MKPTSETIDNNKHGDSFVDHAARPFPMMDCNYQAIALGRSNGGHAGRSRGSFLSISRNYFRHEARWSFVVEILFFTLVIVTAGSALIIGARAIMHFLGLPSAA